MGKHSEIGLHLYNNCSHKWTETEERPILTFCFPRGGGKDHRSFSLTYNGNLLIAALTRSKIQDSEVDNHLWVLVIACNFSHSFGFLHIPLTKADSLNNESFYGTHYTGELTTSGCFFFFFPFLLLLHLLLLAPWNIYGCLCSHCKHIPLAVCGHFCCFCCCYLT